MVQLSDHLMAVRPKLPFCSENTRQDTDTLYSESAPVEPVPGATRMSQMNLMQKALRKDPRF